MPDLRSHVDTSGWVSADWAGLFSPREMCPRDFLARSGRHFGAGKTDSTFCRIPMVKTVDCWKTITPEGLRGTSKVPQTIIHRLLTKQSAFPDDLSRMRLDRKREFTLWPGPNRGHLRRGLMVFAFANNRFQEHGPTTASAVSHEVAGAGPEP